MNENNTEAPKNSGNVISMPPQSTEPTPERKSDVGSLDIVINDRTGIPIPDFEYQILVGTRIAGSGRTDSKGNGKTIEGLKIGSTFDIEVKTDKGEFKYVATGTIEREHCRATLCSKQTRFVFTSVVDKGDPGKAAEHKQKVIAESAKPPTVTTTEHKLKQDKDTKGKPVILVEAAKIKPATAKDIIAALPQVDGKLYAAGVDPNQPIPDPAIAPIPSELVCNEYVFFAYGRAGEKLPYKRPDQLEYFKQQKRFISDGSKGEVGDVGFFDTHEAIIIERREKGNDIWYRYSGARNEDSPSGASTDRKGNRSYLNQNHSGASLLDEKIVPWKSEAPPKGFTGFKGFGKAGR